MTDLERQADEARRLKEGNKHYLKLLELEAIEAMLAAKETADVLDGRLFILAIRKFGLALDSVMTRAVQEGRKAPTVA
jgi:hypothetical protein